MTDLPPQNITAEQSVLGACLVDRDASKSLVGVLTPEDFYSEKHGLVWAAICSLTQRREPVDAVTVVDELKRTGTLDDVGGGGYIAQLINSVAVASNVEAYARMVADCAYRRKAMREYAVLARRMGDMSVALDDLRGDAVRRMLAMTAGGTAGLESPLNVMDWLEAVRTGAAQQKVTPTGLILLDRLCPLKDGKLYIVAGRPGMGKTAFLVRLAKGVARQRPGSYVAYFSLEMDEDAMFPRLLAPEAGVGIQDLEFGRLTDDQWDRVYAAGANLVTQPVLMDYHSSHASESIYAECAKAKARGHNLRLVIVDYLQLLRDKQQRDQRRDQVVGEMGRNMKALSKELHVPVIVAAQLNREVEKRADKKPQLSDLRESGTLEQDADAVEFLHRPDYYDDADRPGWLAVQIAKQRNGRVGEIWLQFDRETGRIDETAPEHWPK